jgi:Fic family protein
MQTAEQAFDSTIRITGLFKVDREHIASATDRAGSALRIHELFQTNPYRTATAATKRSNLTMPTVNSALAELERLKIVMEITGRRRGRVFCYKAFLDILSEAA